MDSKSFLASVSAFSALDSESLDLISSYAVTEKYRKDEVILPEGVTGRNIWVICDGAVSVLQRKEDGNKKEIASLQAGDFFGELSMLSNKPTTAEIQATEPTITLRIPNKRIAPILEKNLVLESVFSQIFIQRNLENSRKKMDKVLKSTLITEHSLTTTYHK